MWKDWSPAARVRNTESHVAAALSEAWTSRSITKCSRAARRTSKLSGVTLTVRVYTLVLAAAAVHAQPANPLSTELLQSYTIIKTNLLKMSQKMPDDAYTFKPT